MTPVRLEPAAPRSRVKHSTTALPVIAQADLLGFKKTTTLNCPLKGHHCRMSEHTI